MPEQVLAYLDIRPSGVYADLTIGQGGHAELILPRLEPPGRLIGLDRDPAALRASAERLRPWGECLRLVHSRFSHLEAVLDELGVEQLDGVLMDTGVSRDQLLDPARGFSFDSVGLSMKLDPTEPGPDAGQMVNTYTVGQLAHLFAIVGKRREGRQVARAIVAFREGKGPIESTQTLAAAIAAAQTGPGHRGKKRHPATPWLMALRIAANDEVEEIRRGVQAAAHRLRPETGRLVVLTWAGHEHGLVRQEFRSLQHPCICPPALPCACRKTPLLRVLTRRPLAATEEEIHRNPAARTCRLQAAVATSEQEREAAPH